jgi:hypothetical protein
VFLLALEQKRRPEQKMTAEESAQPIPELSQASWIRVRDGFSSPASFECIISMHFVAQ